MLNFCIVGTGLMGTRHAHNIFENSRSNLYSVVDTNLQAAKYVAETYGAKIEPDIYSALNDEHVDVHKVLTRDVNTAIFACFGLSSAAHSTIPKTFF